MNGSKRSHTSSKTNASRYNKKIEDILSGKGKLETDLANLPLIKQSDNGRVLPKYSTILSKSVEGGIIMDDLDQLQHELERLLSTSAIRIRYLSEFVEIGRKEDGNDKKGQDKSSLKRKLPDGKPKSNDARNDIRVLKKHQDVPATNVTDDASVPQKSPEVTLPKNDNSEKFWGFIEPFCRNVTKDDVGYLDSLLHEFSKEIDIKIPEIGEHYANSWSEDILHDEQSFGKFPYRKNMNNDIKKNGLQAMVDVFSTPQTQRCLAALTEESVLSTLPQNSEFGNSIKKLKISDFTKLKESAGGQRLGVCLDRKLDELVEQGILDFEDLPKSLSDDEILSEIKKCQQELIAVNEQNIDEVNRLKSIVVSDLRNNALKERMENVDEQLKEALNCSRSQYF